jgi:hypothetical protein
MVASARVIEKTLTAVLSIRYALALRAMGPLGVAVEKRDSKIRTENRSLQLNNLSK